MRSSHTAAPDLGVLDVMLTYLDGCSLCQTMRERGGSTPVLFLSAKGRADDRVKGLEVGEDDYVDNFVVRLRKHFEPKSSKPIYLHTIWGVGYKFTPEVADGG